MPVLTISKVQSVNGSVSNSNKPFSFTTPALTSYAAVGNTIILSVAIVNFNDTFMVSNSVSVAGFTLQGYAVNSGGGYTACYVFTKLVTTANTDKGSYVVSYANPSTDPISCFTTTTEYTNVNTTTPINVYNGYYTSTAAAYPNSITPTIGGTLPVLFLMTGGSTFSYATPSGLTLDYQNTLGQTEGYFWHGAILPGTTTYSTSITGNSYDTAASLLYAINPAPQSGITGSLYQILLTNKNSYVIVPSDYKLLSQAQGAKNFVNISLYTTGGIFVSTANLNSTHVSDIQAVTL